MNPFAEVTALIEWALTEEINTAPKPGLVDRHDSGAHRDMDANTLLLSAKTIAPGLGQMFALGVKWPNRPEELFRNLRPMGRKIEKTMLARTGGVNTHKGAIFTIGLLAAAAGVNLQQNKSLRGECILETARIMCATELRKELERLLQKAPVTHGELLLHTMGCTGIRGEAMAGFPALAELVLPSLRKDDGEISRIRILLRLMLRTQDSTVLYRVGRSGYDWMRERVSDFLSCWDLQSDEVTEKLAELNTEFIRKNVSPGGCADLLAAGLFLYGLEDYFRRLPQSYISSFV